LGLLHQAKGLGGIVDTLNVGESPFQNRLQKECMKGVPIN